MRKIECFRDGWRFARGEYAAAIRPEFDDTAWRTVSVPHDWAAEGPFYKGYDSQFTRIENNGEQEATLHLGRTGGLPHDGKGVYRRRFSLSPSDAGKQIHLEFDGVMSHSRVYVNGKLVGGRPYGYSSFFCDITNAVRFGSDNSLVVTVDNPPCSSRWYPGAGIYRNVRLVIAGELHILPWGVWVRTKKIEGQRAFLSIQVETSGHDEFEYWIVSPRGEMVFSGHGIAGNAEFVLDHFDAWDIESPNLYKVVVTLPSGDSVEQRFGVRDVRFDAEKGMFLNGRNIRMNGVCMHHDLGPLGAAFSRSAAARQLRLLRSVGVNAIRMTHNPPDPGMLDLCDEMGFLAIDEAFDAWRIGKIDNDYHTLFDEWSERDLTDMLRRDRNHPSIVLWSIGNEILEQREKDGWVLAEQLRDIVHRVEPDRPVTAGLSFEKEAVDNGIAAVLDVPGFNYKPHKYRDYHERLPGKPMYGSETASTVSSRGEYFFPVQEGGVIHPSIQCSSYDVEYPSWASTPDREFYFQDRCEWGMGEFVWTGFDYLGEPCPYDNFWPAHSSYFGLFDFVGLPKDRAYLYKSRWTNDPVLHLLPHWNFPNRIGLVTPVHCYTSFEDVELFLNGISQGRKRRNGEYRLRWDHVVYEPGELKAVAYDAEGRILMETVRKTAGEPALLKLELENTRPLSPDGEDLAFVSVTVCDLGEYPHPYAADRVVFNLEGPASFAGIGNGDATCTETFDQHHIHVYNGKAVVYLRSLKGKTGTVTLTATSGNLRPASVTFQVC